MPPILISVIIPVYKVKPEYLHDCLQSVMHQSFNDIEIILVDDGATDDAVRVMNEAASSDDRIKIIKQDHAGVSVARNNGIASAAGKYVTFVDSDDHILPDNLAAAYEFAESNRLDIAIWGTYKCYPGRKDEYMPFTGTIPLLSEDEKRDLTLKTMVGYLPVYGKNCTRCGSGACCSKLYLLSFLVANKIRYPEGVMRSEDVNFNLRAYDKAGRIGYLHRFFYCYRMHDDSATFCYRENGISVFEDALHALRSYLDEAGKSDIFYQVYYMRCVFFFLESMDMDYFNSQNPNPLPVRLKMMKKKLGDAPFSDAVRLIDRRYLTFARRIPVFLMKNRMVAALALFYRVYKKVLA